MALYVTLELFKASLKITSDDRDGALTAALTAASRAVDTHTGRAADGFTLASSAVARQYEVGGNTVATASGRIKLLIDEIGSLDDLAVETGDGTTWTAAADYRVDPLTALAQGMPITALTALAGWGTDLVRVTARWGWPSVPAAIERATLIQATRLYRRKDSPEGVAGQGEFGAIRLSRVDPDVAALLGPYMLPGIA